MTALGFPFAVPFAMTCSIVWLLLPLATPRRTVHTETEALPRMAPPAITRLGAAMRRRVGRPPDTAADRRVGWSLVAGAVAAPVDPLLVPVALIVVATSTRGRRIGQQRRVEEVSRRDLPATADLLSLAIGAGLPLGPALETVAQWAPPGTKDSLGTAARHRAMGMPLLTTVEVLRQRWGDEGRVLASALADHVHYGTPLEAGLARAGDELRRAQRRHVETRARRLPVLLLFPLVLCTLPAFGLLTVAPVVAGTLRSLQSTAVEDPSSTTVDTVLEDDP